MRARQLAGVGSNGLEPDLRLAQRWPADYALPTRDRAKNAFRQLRRLLHAAGKEVALHAEGHADAGVPHGHMYGLDGSVGPATAA